MKNLIYVIFLISIVSFSCSEKKIPKADIYSLRKIGMLSTTEYSIGKVVKLNDEPEWYKFGDRKILISCKAKIKAGVNLMEAEIKEVDGKTIITLPPSEISSFAMDPNKIITEMQDVNGLRSSFTQEDKNKIMKQGEMAILKQINQSNIYKEAENNAEMFVIDFFSKAGLENIEVQIKPRNATK